MYLDLAHEIAFTSVNLLLGILEVLKRNRQMYFVLMKILNKVYHSNVPRSMDYLNTLLKVLLTCCPTLPLIFEDIALSLGPARLSHTLPHPSPDV